MTTTATAIIGDKTVAYRPEVYRPCTIYFLTPWSRHHDESLMLRLEMVTTHHRVATLRTIYRALRNTGMSRATTRFRIYDIMADTAAVWPGVKQVGGQHEAANR